MMARGVRADEFVEEPITACWGDADASGVAPPRPTEHVAKLNDAFWQGRRARRGHKLGEESGGRRGEDTQGTARLHRKLTFDQK